MLNIPFREIRLEGDAAIGPENTAEVMDLVSGMSLKRLKEILDAEQDRRCIVSPFRSGDSVVFNCPDPLMHGAEMRGIMLALHCSGVGYEHGRTFAEIQVERYGKNGIFEGTSVYAVPLEEVRHGHIGITLRGSLGGEADAQ